MSDSRRGQRAATSPALQSSRLRPSRRFWPALGRQENPAATRALLEAATALPDEHLAGLAERVVEWVRGPYPEYFSDQRGRARPPTSCDRTTWP